MANFALFDLCGKQLSPRIRDLAHITLCRPGPRAEYAARYPHAGPLLTRRLQSELITGCWDDLLRVAASVHGGHAAAALVVGKLCSSKKQQNTLTAAMKEYGTLRRTIFAARYLADEAYQRRIGRQLNKGENIHTLKRNIAHARQGTLRRRHPRAADRADVVPDPGHQRGRVLDDRVSRPGRGRPARHRTPGR